MVKMYKLVSQGWKTHTQMHWQIGKTNKAKVDGKEMCTNQVLHCYLDPRLAIIFNPVHANISNPILLEINCSPIINTDGLKYACKEQTPVKQIQVPQITTTQRVAFAIKTVMLVYKNTDFIKWAENWLSGVNRTAAAARAAADAAYAAADAAARVAAYAAYAAADAAARVAAYAAYAAADAAADVAADAAYAAAYAAAVAAVTAYAAYAAADAAAFGTQLVEIIDWVMENIS